MQQKSTSIVEDIKLIPQPSSQAQVGTGRAIVDAKKVKDTVKP